jgi:hypothetical protein
MVGSESWNEEARRARPRIARDHVNIISTGSSGLPTLKRISQLIFEMVDLLVIIR